MFSHRQEIDAAGRVLSVQSLQRPLAQSPTPADAAEAGRRYWAFLRRLGLGLLIVKPRSDGGVDVGVPGLVLLAFGAPAIEEHEGGYAVRYRILEGALVQRSGRGQGFLLVGLGSHRVTLAVDGYYAALVGPRRHPVRVGFYLATQSAIHVAVARGFLRSLIL